MLKCSYFEMWSRTKRIPESSGPIASIYTRNWEVTFEVVLWHLYMHHNRSGHIHTNVQNAHTYKYTLCEIISSCLFLKDTAELAVSPLTCGRCFVKAAAMFESVRQPSPGAGLTGT